MSGVAPWAAAGALLPTFVVTFATLVIACEIQGIAPFWPANAVVVTLLLQTPMRGWWKGVLAGGLGLIAARLLVGCSPLTALTLSAINLMEVLICAFALAAVARGQVDWKRPAHLAAFVLAAGFLAPLSSAACAAWYLSQSRHDAFLPDLTAWYLGDACGLIVATPILLAGSVFFWRRFGSDVAGFAGRTATIPPDLSVAETQ